MVGDFGGIFGGKNVDTVVDDILSAPNVKQTTSRVLMEIKEAKLKPVIESSVIQSLWSSLSGRVYDVMKEMGDKMYGEGKVWWSPLSGRHGLKEEDSLILNRKVREVTTREDAALQAIREYLSPNEISNKYM